MLNLELDQYWFEGILVTVREDIYGKQLNKRNLSEDM